MSDMTTLSLALTRIRHHHLHGGQRAVSLEVVEVHHDASDLIAGTQLLRFADVVAEQLSTGDAEIRQKSILVQNHYFSRKLVLM